MDTNHPVFIIRHVTTAQRKTKKPFQLLEALPFSDLILEDEIHVLRTCPRYHHLRLPLDDNIKTLIFLDIQMLFKVECINKTSRFIHKILRCRNPKDSLKRKKLKVPLKKKQNPKKKNGPQHAAIHT